MTTVGALVLALLFASLSRRLPADGGPYAYARVGFGNGLGERHRLSVIGPGVTPIVQVIVPRLTRFDAAAQRAATERFDEILGGDRHCARER